MTDFNQILEFKPSISDWEILLSTSRQAIEAHEKDGHYIVKGKTLKVGLDSAFGYMRDAAAGRIKSESNDILNDAKTRQCEIKIKLDELKFGVAAKNLLPLDITRAFLSDLIITLKQELEDSFPATLSQEIKIFFQADVPDDFIKEYVIKTLERTSRSIRELVKQAN